MISTIDWLKYVCVSLCVIYRCILGLGNSMIVIHCCGSWSTIMMMIVLFPTIVVNMVFNRLLWFTKKACFMQSQRPKVDILTLTLLGI